MNVVNSCLLCSTNLESHSHLFFQCSFSSTLWYGAWNKVSVSGISNNLDDIVAWFNLNVQGKSSRSLLMRSILAAAVYLIWRERNLRFSQGKTLHVELLALQLVNSIRDFLSSRRGVRPSARNKALAGSWNLPRCIFS
ncbi:hypothetical protein RHMOL_Rhmol06G0210100 [Rhododendron molle]|uniref:Uncharacterized protein n=1 Tax=Rhododendron molle TaxID=49168 RepID=A0ACC0NF81_RHOML|nr:hypothetical protein RHMOL_Rhmol06G0210100 [Rhododendron molle]